MKCQLRDRSSSHTLHSTDEGSAEQQASKTFSVRLLPFQVRTSTVPCMYVSGVGWKSPLPALTLGGLGTSKTVNDLGHQQQYYCIYCTSSLLQTSPQILLDLTSNAQVHSTTMSCAKRICRCMSHATKTTE